MPTPQILQMGRHVNQETAQKLIALNTQFYNHTASSFAATRQTGWPGWEPVTKQAVHLWHEQGATQPLRILDIACGNLRFGEYVAEHVAPNAQIEITALDNCQALMTQHAQSLPSHVVVRPIEIDCATHVLAGKQLPIKNNAFDVTVAFGFFHHIPTQAARIQLLTQMLQARAPQGIVAVSLWCFLNAPDLAQKALETTRLGCKELNIEQQGDFGLEQGDYLLGWNNQPGLYRYCHSFSDEDIDQLIAAGKDQGGRLLARYMADGRTGNLNTYLIFA